MINLLIFHEQLVACTVYIDDLNVFVLIHVIDVVVAEERFEWPCPFGDRVGERNVGEVGVLQEPVCNVDPKPVDAPVEPELVDRIELRAHRGISPIQVGLLGEEQVAVVLPARFVERPGGRAEMAHPIVRWAATWRGVPEQVVVAFRRARIREGCLEPSMFTRGVVRDNIENDAEIELVGSSDQPVDVVERAVTRINVAVIRDVVAMVVPWRGVERGEPDDVDTEPLEVIQTVGDPSDVADAITVTVRIERV